MIKAIKIILGLSLIKLSKKIKFARLNLKWSF